MYVRNVRHPISNAAMEAEPSNIAMGMEPFQGAIRPARPIYSLISPLILRLPLLVALLIAFSAMIVIYLFQRVSFFISGVSPSQSTETLYIIVNYKKDKERFGSVVTYLTHKIGRPSSAPITKLPKPKNSHALEIEDTFDGVRFKWSLRSEEHKKLGIIPWPRKIQYFELSFPDGYKSSRVDSDYLPYIRKEAASIEAEKKKLRWERIQALGWILALGNAIVNMMNM